MLSKVLHSEVNALWQFRIDTDPELAASLGLLSHRRSSHALDPRSLASFQARLTFVQACLKRTEQAVEELSADPANKLTDEDQLCLDLHLEQMREYVKYHKYKSYLTPVNRLEGPQNDLPLYASYLGLKTSAEQSFYLSFLSAVPQQIDDVIALMQEGVRGNWLLAKCSMDGVPGQVDSLVTSEGAPFLRRVDDIKDEKVAEAIRAAVRDLVVPAFAKLKAFLLDEYVPKCPEAIAVKDRHPAGVEFYEACLKFHTTTDMTPQEVHDLGLSEVRRINSEMTAIAAEKGMTVPAYNDYLRTAEETDPVSAEELLKTYRDICSRISPELLKLFHLKTLPRTPYSIAETPARQASQAPAAYYLAGAGGRPGVFYVNTSEISTRRTFECEALALHEAIPGHHTQAAVCSESDDLQDFRRHAEDRRYFEAPCRFPFYTGYIEGWGLHAESLGEELGLYKTSAARMGRLSMEMLRACRLVVDTGMHCLGWSRDRALQFMLDNTAMSENDAGIEVTRYITWPGQATAYKVGERKIRALRTKFEQRLPNGDIRDFYDIVLLGGAVPLTLLEAKVDAFIEKSLLEGEVGGGKGTTKPKAEDMEDFLKGMSFAQAPWCKCCTVPGTCKL